MLPLVYAPTPTHCERRLLTTGNIAIPAAYSGYGLNSGFGVSGSRSQARREWK